MDKDRAQAFYEKAYHAVKDNIPYYTKCLADIGWYINDSTTLGVSIHAYYFFKLDRIDVVDKIFSEYVESEINKIFDRLINLYPDITVALNEAKSCVDNEMYFAAIPLLVSMSEYIAEKISKKSHFLFTTEKRGPKRFNKAELLYGSKLAKHDLFGHRSIIAKNHSFNEHDKFSLSDSNKINRHAILHGRDIKYGTRVNALKTISFLNYVELTLRGVESHEN